MTSPFTCAQGAIDAATNPEEAVNTLTTFWIGAGLCLTSGHIVHAVRSARTDLVFGQARIGAALRGLYENNQLPGYEDGTGNVTPVVRVPRRTTLTTTRTPVGTEVLVYGPSEAECLAFEFELNIASAPDVSDGQGGTISAAAALLGATPNLQAGAPGASPIPPVTTSGTVAVAHGKLSCTATQAVIHLDGRLCIPRLAFEALAFETGTPIKGGEALFLEQDGQTLTISQDQTTTTQVEVHPTTDRLRLHLRLPKVYPVGTTFPIAVGPDGLTITLT